MSTIGDEEETVRLEKKDPVKVNTLNVSYIYDKL